MSHVLHSPYYPIHHITPSPVVYKSYPLVVSSSACNCHYFFVSYYSLSLPVILPPENTIPLCLPCLSPLKLRTTLFSSKGTTHKLKPSPYFYAVVLHIPHSIFCTPHSILLTSPPYLPDSGIPSTLSFSHSIP